MYVYVPAHNARGAPIDSGRVQICQRVFKNIV